MARKDFKADLPSPSSRKTEGGIDSVTSLPPPSQVVRFPTNRVSRKDFNFGPFYGHGCDQIVWAYQHTIELMIVEATKTEEQTLAMASVVSYCSNGVRWFLPFCVSYAAALGRELFCSDLDRAAIDKFLADLAQSDQAATGQKAVYSHVKSVIRSICRRESLPEAIFPKNPFPRINRKFKGERALSKRERSSVLNALKQDVHRIERETAALSAYDLAILLMAIAARTGLNPTPLLELPIDCLQPHPLKADRQLLVSFKRRGRNTHVQNLRKSGDIELMKTVLPDVSRIITTVVSRNAAVRTRSSFPNYLFVHVGLYKAAGSLLLLSATNLKLLIRRWTNEHRLLGDDGQPLRMNISRLRKTFENRIYELSGQDPFLTAKMAGHSPKVSNDHYLEAPPEAERNWRLMGEIRTVELRRSTQRTATEENTPVAHCKDTKDGELAPRDGSHCQRFLACFRCRSFVVTGDDLYRLFSLYWMLVRERASIGARRWQRLYAHIIRIIDDEIAPRFTAKQVEVARTRAKVDPHPFWRSADMLEILS